MNIVIVAQYLRNVENFRDNNSRFVYLAKMLRDNHHTVEIITSDYYHRTKQHFTDIGDLPGITVTTLHESGYLKNISLKRLLSHKELANNLKYYLDSIDKPDVVYTAVPSLSVAEVCANYCNNNDVKFVVDIQDLWPEAFQMVFNVASISNLIFRPMTKQADRIYAAADEIVAVSKTYADRGMKVNEKCEMSTVAFLGTDKAMFDCHALREKNDDEIVVVYIGTLGHSYDLNCVIDALAKLQVSQKVRFLVMGDGPLRQKFENASSSKRISHTFTGTLPYTKMIEKLSQCDIAVNPIKKGAAQSIINKTGDYAMAGLPVVNTQENIEYKDLLDEYNAGINCECENSDDVAKALENLIMNASLREQMSTNSRTLGEEKFDRQFSYNNIIYAITKNKDNE